MIIDRDYKYYTDENGVEKAFNTNTGEVTDTFTATYPVGTISYTPEQQERYKEQQERKAEQERKAKLKEISQAANHPLGRFVFVNIFDGFKGLPPATLARLFFLVSYYDEKTGTLVRGRSSILRRDLPELLKITKGAVTKFLGEVSPRYIIVNEDKTISVNEEVFCKGRLLFTPAIRLYKNGIQSLYQETEQSQVRHLGYIFALIPFLNAKYNVLSYDTEQTSVENIRPITLKEFCDLIDFDFSNVSRLKKIYQQLTFPTVDGKREHFVYFVGDGINAGDATIIVNPRILYRGSDFRAVEAYTIHFREKETEPPQLVIS